MTTDHFAADRSRLDRVTDDLGEAAVTLGEWVADNVFGDPGLRDAMRYAQVAADAARAATVLADEARRALPAAQEEPS